MWRELERHTDSDLGERVSMLTHILTARVLMCFPKQRKKSFLFFGYPPVVVITPALIPTPNSCFLGAMDEKQTGKRRGVRSFVLGSSELCFCESDWGARLGKGNFVLFCSCFALGYLAKLFPSGNDLEGATPGYGSSGQRVAPCNAPGHSASSRRVHSGALGTIVFLQPGSRGASTTLRRRLGSRSQYRVLRTP